MTFLFIGKFLVSIMIEKFLTKKLDVGILVECTEESIVSRQERYE